MISFRSAEFLNLFLVTLLITVMSKGVALFPAYSIDDWVQAPQLLDHEHLISHVLSEGRFGQAFVIRMLGHIHATLYSISFLGVFVSIVAIALFSSIASEFMLIEGRWQKFLFSSFIANHPYTIEIFTWKSVVIFYGASLILLSISMVRCSRNLLDFMVSCAAIAVAISFYQPILSFVIVLVLARWVGEALNDGAAEGVPRVARRLFCSCVVGTALYFALSHLFQAVYDFDLNSRASLIDVGRMDERMQQALLFYRSYFYGAEMMHPAPIKFLLLATISFGYVYMIWQAIRIPARGACGARVVCWHGLLAIGIFLSSLSFLIVLSLWWPVPRMLSHAGLVWGALLLPALYFAKKALSRAVITSVLALTVLAYIAINNAVLSDQIRLNQQDRLRVSRIVADVERLPTFKDIEELHVVGHEPFANRITWVAGEMNTSGMYGSFGIFSEIFGLPAKRGRTEDCEQSPRWPAERSIFARGKVAIVCLSE